MLNTVEDYGFGIGDAVNVTRVEGDQFNNDFTGRVVGFHGECVTVEDQDGDAWDCEPWQLSFNSDEYMH